MPDNAALKLALEAHDEAIAKTAGLAIWLGAEPTFTDRTSEAAEWLYRAEGGEKSKRALAMLAEQCANRPNPLLLRSIGRQYPGEELPRWSFGLYERRDLGQVWNGPPDPVLDGRPSAPQAVEDFPQHLQSQFLARNWKSHIHVEAEENSWRIVFRYDGLEPPRFEEETRLFRPSIHGGSIPEEGLQDALADEGNYLILVTTQTIGEESEELPKLSMPCVELPALPSVSVFLECVGEIGKAAQKAGLSGLVLQGHPPPVDASVAWATFTPDPAVVEVNMAPEADAVNFYASVCDIYHCALKLGLSPYRFYYNGDVTDSGGGGQITFGGPSAESSPFFVKPWLLPNIVRYFHRHPSLSYFFTPSCVGSSSQSPRPDERFRESFEEMRLALALLSTQDCPSPDTLWGSLAPFLSDTSGNNHRSEINVEKLWNPFLGKRGRSGLVEFRAFRMARSPEMLAARAVLFRALLAMLAKMPDQSDLTDWGSLLHDRFALPHYLKQDLNLVLDDLAAAGFGLAPVLVEWLMDDDDRLLGGKEINGFELTVRRALEFWPLVGDVASQESGNSRLIDSSTARIQVMLRPVAETAADIGQWRISYKNWQVPVRIEADGSGPFLLFGFKYRAFSPWRGLHPTLPAQTPVEFVLRHESSGESWSLALHEWKPQGGAYASLPQDWDESRFRRDERVVVESLAKFEPSDLCQPPSVAVMPYCLDLRAYGIKT